MFRRLRLRSRDELQCEEIKKILFIGDYPPRHCGIATFTFDLCTTIRTIFPLIKNGVVVVNDIPEGYDYPFEVMYQIEEQDPVSYGRAADYIARSGADLVCVQHEFEIYGGHCGAMLLPLLKQLKIPVVTTLHSILEEPSHLQRQVLNKIIECSSRVITMTDIGKKILSKVYEVDPKRVAVIPHGTSEMEFPNPEIYKKETGLSGYRVILTSGLLSPNKGIEYAIKALPELVKVIPDALYVILGQTHPNIIREHGEAYRKSLMYLVRELDVHKNVQFINKFVDMTLLKKYIASCDVYLTPYLHEQQVTSGTLSYAFGMGSAVVSTPYRHAAELLSEGRGRLVPFRDSAAISKQLIDILTDNATRNTMKANAFEYGRTMTWTNIAKRYFATFDEARLDPVSTFAQIKSPASLPGIKLDHLFRMTDDTGLIQHAVFGIPDYRHGYCVDDNGRALEFCANLKRLNHPLYDKVRPLVNIYSSYIAHAFNAEKKCFKNFYSYDRRWLDDTGTDDSNCRGMRGVGACCRAGIMTEWAVDLFMSVAFTYANSTSIRARANLLLSMSDFFKAFPKSDTYDFMDKDKYDKLVQVRDNLARQLITEYQGYKTEKWNWFEGLLAYENAIFPHALIVTGHDLNDTEMQNIGLDTLDWLMDKQVNEDVIFLPIGNEDWYRMNGTRSIFDQQCIEAGATVLALTAAYDLTKEPMWMTLAHTTFDWFLGKNLTGRVLYNSDSGGLGDGLRRDGVNQNEGAESLVVFLLARLRLEGVAMGEEKKVVRG